mgnify:CR=1 FL=1
MIKKYNNIIFFIALFVAGAVLLFPELAEATDKCDISKMQEQYTRSCFTCPIVATIISIFLEVGADSYPLMRSAANTLLGILSVLWIAVYFLKKLSSFSAVELPEMMQELSIFFFKIIVAVVCINGGIGVILDFTINPIISFGSDFGTAFLKLTADIPVKQADVAPQLMDTILKLKEMEVLYA